MLEKESIEKSAKQGLSNILSENPNVVDLLLGRKNVQVVSSEQLIEEVQKRVWSALKKDFPYSNVTKDSERFLRENVLSDISMVVLYVDLVGSTKMVMDLPRNQLASIITSFTQEMAYVIKQHNGLILKFVGDAVIGYFPKVESVRVADSAISCAESMIKVVKMGINPILSQYDFPDLQVKIGIDFGNNTVIRYGNDEDSHVDLLGPSMNMAAKIQSIAYPDQILIGEDVFNQLDPNIQEYFEQLEWKKNEWHYTNRLTGRVYSVYAYVGK